MTCHLSELGRKGPVLGGRGRVRLESLESKGLRGRWNQGLGETGGLLAQEEAEAQTGEAACPGGAGNLARGSVLALVSRTLDSH